MPEKVTLHADGRSRCWWCGTDPLYVAYHDGEWGVPVRNDVRLFEKITLEGFQSGLSWLTILRKRENFRAAFDGFDFEAIAKYGARKVNSLLKDAGIVRHRGKIESTINNAKRAHEMVDEFGSIAAFAWQFEPAAADRPSSMDWASLSQLGQTEASARLSRELKKRGWSFVGPTTMYAFMQAMGMVNDHLEGCDTRAPRLADRKKFKVPAR
ncbi:MAG: DNA-3-methyladenine glycosylase I [bacterium]